MAQNGGHHAGGEQQGHTNQTKKETCSGQKNQRLDGQGPLIYRQSILDLVLPPEIPPIGERFTNGRWPAQVERGARGCALSKGSIVSRF